MFKEVTDPTSGKKEPSVLIKIHGLTVLRVWSFYSECPKVEFAPFVFWRKGCCNDDLCHPMVSAA